MIRAALHHLAADLVGALFGCLILCGYALAVTFAVYGIIWVIARASPQIPPAASETNEDRR